LTTTWAKRSRPAFVLRRWQGCILYAARWIPRIDILGTLIPDNIEFGRLVTIKLGDPDVHLYMTFAIFFRHIEADDLAWQMGRQSLAYRLLFLGFGRNATDDRHRPHLGRGV